MRVLLLIALIPLSSCLGPVAGNSASTPWGASHLNDRNKCHCRCGANSEGECPCGPFDFCKTSFGPK